MSGYDVASLEGAFEGCFAFDHKTSERRSPAEMQAFISDMRAAATRATTLSSRRRLVISPRHAFATAIGRANQETHSILTYSRALFAGRSKRVLPLAPKVGMGPRLISIAAEGHDVGGRLPDLFVRQHTAPRWHPKRAFHAALGDCLEYVSRFQVTTSSQLDGALAARSMAIGAPLFFK
jgi:hypothetical protein